MYRKILIGISLLLVIGLLAGCSGVKQEDLDAAKARENTLQSEMNSMQSQLDTANAAKSHLDANKALVASYYQAIGKGDTTILAQIFAPDFKQYVSGATPPIDIDGKVKRLVGFKTAAPDIKITVNNMTAEGDYVTVVMTVKGTNQGAFMGIPPTGKAITVTAIEVFHIENGKIVEQWGGPDLLDLLQQIGAVISAGQ